MLRLRQIIFSSFFVSISLRQETVNCQKKKETIPFLYTLSFLQNSLSLSPFLYTRSFSQNSLSFFISVSLSFSQHISLLFSEKHYLRWVFCPTTLCFYYLGTQAMKRCLSPPPQPPLPPLHPETDINIESLFLSEACFIWKKTF